MIGDRNPSVVCALFCTNKKFDKFMELVDKRKGMRVRELRFVDIGIPLDENFNDNINFLKAGSNPIMGRFFDVKLPFGLEEKMFKKMGLKKFDYSKRWETDLKNPLLYAGITPLFVDDKYCSEDNYTPEEMERCRRLLSWDTPDYEPDKSILVENQTGVKE